MKDEAIWVKIATAIFVIAGGIYLLTHGTVIGAVGLSIVVGLAWLWRRLDDYMLQRHERQRAEHEAEADREAGPLIDVHESSLAIPPGQDHANS